jgi:WD40 repeat protein
VRRNKLTAALAATCVIAAAASPDGKRLASGSGRYQFGGPGGVHVWDPWAGRLVFDLKGHRHCVWAVTFSADGRQLVSTGGAWRPDYAMDGGKPNPNFGPGELRVWDAETGQEVLAASPHTATAYGAAFTPDGAWFATAGWDKLIRVWDLRPGQPVAAAPPAIRP